MKQILFLTSAMAITATAALADVTISTDPANGSTLSELKSISILFEGQAGVAADQSFPTLDVLDAEGNKVAIAKCMSSSSTTIGIRLIPTLYAQGTYSFSIPAFTFYTYDYDQNWERTNSTYYEQDINFSYTLDGSGSAPELDASLISDPANEVGFITSVKITSKDYAVVSKVTDGPLPYLLDTEGNKLYDCSVSTTGSWATPSGQITMPELLCEPGQYSLVIPAGVFRLYEDSEIYDADYNTKIAGRLNDETIFVYNITGEGVDHASSVPANGSVTNDLSSITLTFDEAAAVAYKTMFTPFGSLKNAEGKEIAKYWGIDSNMFLFEGNTLTFYTAVSEDGIYSLTVPDGSISITDAEGNTHYNTVLNFTYTLDHTVKVTTFKGASNASVVFDLQGRQVYELEKGKTYISNGITFIIH